MESQRSTFRRKEIKYQLDASALSTLWRIVATHLPSSVFGTSWVSSLYLDTPDRSIIAHSMEKPLYKEKLRLRWYGAQSLGQAQDVFVELKKKYKGIVYKRRLLVDAAIAQAFVDRKPQALGDSQIACELEAAHKRMGPLVPSALVMCQRTSFGSDDEGALRVTFDTDLHVRDLFAEDRVVHLLEPAHGIMEVKSAGAYPFWLVQALSKMGIYPSSFSKYGAFYQRVSRQPQMARREVVHA